MCNVPARSADTRNRSPIVVRWFRMYLRVIGRDQVELDGHAGHITFDHLNEDGELEVAEYRVRFRLYGPFGQGYNFGIFVAGQERLTLEYTWRDGLQIYDPRARDQQLWIEGNILTDGVRRIGKFSYSSRAVAVKLDARPSPFTDINLALLVALDVMYANKIVLFART